MRDVQAVEFPAVLPTPAAIESKKEPVVLPFKIGIAPVASAELSPPSNPPAPPVILGMDGEPADKLTWPKYLAWRKTKCRPYDYENGPKLVNLAVNDAFHGTPDNNKARALEEIDQATHEFVGEVAELGELLMSRGPMAFYEDRSKLVDEIGDVLFCGAWVLDAWGKNPLNDATDELEIIDISSMDRLQAIADMLAKCPIEKAVEIPGFMDELGSSVMSLFTQASVQAGLLCNSYKKLRFQCREQDVDTQVARVVAVFVIVSQILGIASASVEDALRTNMRKLDARFPEGYKPGVGGGIRTGDGK